MPEAEMGINLQLVWLYLLYWSWFGTKCFEVRWKYNNNQQSIFPIAFNIIYISALSEMIYYSSIVTQKSYAGGDEGIFSRFVQA